MTKKKAEIANPSLQMEKASSSNASTEDSADLSIPKSVGLLSAIGMIAGQIIGSGIFISPVGVLRQVHSAGAALIIWVIGGFIAFVGANCYTELGTMIKESGGDYMYLNIGFGNFISFLYLWVFTFMVQPGNRAVVALTFATYILKPFFPTCDPPKYAVILLAAFVITLTTVINCISVKAVARIQVIFMITKCAALAMIAITGIVYLGMGRTQNFEDVFSGTSTNPGDWAMGIYSCVFTYAGWNYVTAVAEEVKKPEKTLPRGLWISVPMVTLLYVTTNLAFFVVLDIPQMLETSAVAVTFGNKVYGVMKWIIPVFVACSTFGGLNSLTYLPSRLYFVAARQGHMPSFLKTLNTKYLTPIPCLIVQLLITMAVLFSGEVFMLITCVSFIETTFIGLSVSAMLYMRYKHPHWKRPIKVNLFFPIVYLCIVIFLLVLTLINGAMEALIGIILTLLGIPAYWVFVCWKSKPKAFDNFMVSVTVFMQKLCCSAPENSHVRAVEEDNEPAAVVDEKFKDS